MHLNQFEPSRRAIFGGRLAHWFSLRDLPPSVLDSFDQ